MINLRKSRNTNGFHQKVPMMPSEAEPSQASHNMKIRMVILSRQLLSRECNKRRGPRVKRPSCANTSPLHRCFFDLKCFKFSLLPLHGCFFDLKCFKFSISPLHGCFLDLKCFKFSPSPLHRCFSDLKCFKFSLGKGKPRSWSQVGKVSQVEWIPL